LKVAVDKEYPPCLLDKGFDKILGYLKTFVGRCYAQSEWFKLQREKGRPFRLESETFIEA
jgi:hypothetical protein